MKKMHWLTPADSKWKTYVSCSKHHKTKKILEIGKFLFFVCQEVNLTWGEKKFVCFGENACAEAWALFKNCFDIAFSRLSVT